LQLLIIAEIKEVNEKKIPYLDGQANLLLAF
jgi:hypothetical protein